MFARMTPEEQSREIARLDYEANTAEAASRLDYQVKFAEMVFRALVLVNGGALIALFTLIGNVGKNSSLVLSLKLHLLWYAFGCFSAGLVLVLAGGIFAFFTQYHFLELTQRIAWHNQRLMVGMQSEPNLTGFKAGNVFIGLSVLVIVLSLATFICGSALALAAVLPS